MDIFSNLPSDWIDLQNKVAHILCSCGYDTKTPQKLKTVRGDVEVDVYATNDEMKIICECKYWEQRIPQNVVFAFRTVITDIGANKGIIIAKNGFQSGAIENINGTNLELYTWQQFQEQYKKKYLLSWFRFHAKIHSKLFRIADLKSEYWEYYDKLNEHDRFNANKLLNQLMNILFAIGPIQTTYFYSDVEENVEEELGWIIKSYETRFGVLFESYYDFFKCVNNEIVSIISRLNKLYQIELLNEQVVEYLMRYDENNV